MSRSADVLIVGGGPAGSSLARELVRGGLQVVVLDRLPFPRDKVCAGWITPAVVEALELDAEDYARQRVLQPIHGFRVGLIGRQPRWIRFDGEPVSYGILRRQFDDYLLRRSGASLRLGEPLASIERDGEGFRINGELRTRLVVGAGGHFCPVARKLDPRPRRAGAVLAQEVEFEMESTARGSCPVDGAVPELYFCADLEGYGWIFRKGDHLNVGLGRQDPHRLAEHVDAFCGGLIAAGRLPRAMPRKFRGHAYRLYPDGDERVVDDGMMLIGDAAGLAYPQSGEGIRPAVESALLAAQVILEAQGDYGHERLASYGRRLARRFGARRAVAGRARLLPSALRTALASRLLGNRWFSKRIVLDRWFLHRHVPALRPLATRLAITGPRAYNPARPRGGVRV